MDKCNVKALALGIGLTWGIYMVLIGWAAACFNWGTNFVNAMSSVYIGFTPDFVGGIIGGVWGFVDGAIAGLLIAYFYNIFAKKK